MAVTQKAVFPQAPQSAVAICTAACTTYGDTVNKQPLITAGANGAMVISLTAIPRATVTATQLQVYRSPDAGTTMYFLTSALMAAYSMAQTTQAAPTPLLHPNGSAISVNNPLILKPNEKLYVAIGVALSGGIVFSADYMDF